MDSKPDSVGVERFIEREDELGNFEEILGPMLFHFLKKYRGRILQYIADTDETDTYGEILTRSIRTALKLKEKGIGRGDIISTCSYNHKNSCIPVLAAFFLGAIQSHLHPDVSHLDTIHLLKLIEPKIIFVSQETVVFMEQCLAESDITTELVVFGESTVYDQFDEYLEPHLDEKTFEPTPIGDSRETAAILFSSGTTGLPKGICLSHRALLGQINKAYVFSSNAGARPQFVNLIYATFYWISGVIFFIDTIANGDAEVVCSKFDPCEAWKILEKYKVTCLVLTSYLANEFVLHPSKDIVTSLRMFLTGGSPVTKKLMEDLKTALPNTVVMNGYGQTEAASLFCKFNIRKPAEVEMQNKKPLSCGKIGPEYLWKVVDPNTEQVLGPYERGELRIKNDFMMNGYYKMDSLSAFDSEGYLKTGDILYYDDEECFYVVDRIKEVFKYKGWHIIPAILEDILKSHPAVKEAAVIGIPQELDGEHAKGVVVLYDEFKHVTANEIEKFVEEKVPEIQRLRAGVKIVKELVKTATGKIKRAELKNKVIAGEI